MKILLILCALVVYSEHKNTHNILQHILECICSKTNKISTRYENVYKESSISSDSIILRKQCLKITWSCYTSFVPYRRSYKRDEIFSREPMENFNTRPHSPSNETYLNEDSVNKTEIFFRRRYGEYPKPILEPEDIPSSPTNSTIEEYEISRPRKKRGYYSTIIEREERSTTPPSPMTLEDMCNSFDEVASRSEHGYENRNLMEDEEVSISPSNSIENLSHE